MMDFSCEAGGKGPAVQMHSLREFEQHLNDLKKENFSLKLRIYFLEEKIQQKFEESSDDVHRRDIELKVQVESLKKELEDKQQLLDEALLRADGLSDQTEAELQRRLEERQEEISHMQELLENKVQLLQEEAELARGEAERMASLADAESRRCLALEREREERMEESGASVFTQQALADKDRVIKELTQQKLALGLLVEELEVKVHNHTGRGDENLDDGDVHTQMQRLIDEQQDQLSHYESTAGQCVGELQKNQDQVRSLQKNQDQVRSLQDKIRESEARNQKLQLRLGEMELELRSTREEAQEQERNIQNISDNFSSKEAEAADLYLVIEEQKKMLCSLKELTNHQQASGVDSVGGQGEVLSLQASLFQAQLELQAGERAQQQASRTQEDLTRALHRLETDLQGALQHRRDAEQHNQELQSVLDKARSALQEREEQLREGEQERESEKEEREKIITQLTTSLQTKDQLLEEYWELLEDQSNQKRDAQLLKLRQRVRERDGALERAVDERFRCVEEKEEESRRLRLLLREKERDLERQRCVLDNNEETITSLELLLRGKAVELHQVVDAWRNVQKQQQQSEEMRSWTLRERDAIIGQLQGALLARSQEAQDLRCSLLAQVHSAPSDVLEELKIRLQLKDRLFQEVLSDRTRQAQEHQDQVQGLLTSISSRDQYIQDSALQLGDVMTEQTSRLQELRRQLSSGPGWRSDSGADSALEQQAVQEELRLALRREKENQELSRSQTARLDALSRTLLVKEELIRDFQRQMVEPSDLQLVERLTQEVQELRESLVQRDGAALLRQPEFGGGHQRSMGQYL